MTFNILKQDDFDSKPIAYWKLQDDEPKLESLASGILRYYIQNNADSEKERCESLIKGAEYARFRGVEFIEDKTKDISGFKTPDKISKLFDEFRQEIRSISRGRFENEVYSISRILKKYRKLNTNWHQKLIDALHTQ